MIRFTVAAALITLVGIARADETLKQAEANFNSACSGIDTPRDEACGIAMEYMYLSTLDAISDCIKEGGPKDVTACVKRWGKTVGLNNPP